MLGHESLLHENCFGMSEPRLQESFRNFEKTRLSVGDSASKDETSSLNETFLMRGG